MGKRLATPKLPLNTGDVIEVGQRISHAVGNATLNLVPYLYQAPLVPICRADDDQRTLAQSPPSIVAASKHLTEETGPQKS